MAGRHRLPRHFDERDLYNGPFPPHVRQGLPVPHPSVLEEDLLFQQAEIRRLLAENKRLAEDNAAYQRELMVTKEDIHSLSQVIPKVQAEKELHARELVDKAMKLEADIHSAEPLRAEVLQLRAEAQKLSSIKQELTAKVQDLTHDLNKILADNQQLPVMKADVDNLHQELERARSAFEFEKKANLEQFEHKKGMEKNLISMAREIENLRGELIGSDKRLDASSGGYGLYKGNQELGYGGSYGDIYGSEKGWSSAYEKRGSLRH